MRGHLRGRESERTDIKKRFEALVVLFNLVVLLLRFLVAGGEKGRSGERNGA